jgi:spore coat polysaccharide biosynthesis protein SpsF
MKIVATIEARMNSSRLPGKVLMDIGGLRSLECQIRRMRRSRYIDEIIIATTVNSCDDEIVDFSKNEGVAVYRGSENDVMSRILEAATSINGDLQIQITGDCPLIDPVIIDEVVQVYLESNGKYDFVSNEIKRSYPIGLDCRVFPVQVLKLSSDMCHDSTHRVHGSTFITHGEGVKIFSSKNIIAPEKLNFPNYRWTLDEVNDLKFLKRVLQNFGVNIIEASSYDIMNWLNQNSDVIDINLSVKQKGIEEG